MNDLDSGFMDKMRVAPINKSSILFGKLFSDAITIMVQVVIILVIGVALGVQVASGPAGWLMILILSALFGMAWSGISLFVADHQERSDHAVGRIADHLPAAIPVRRSDPGPAAA